MTTEIVVTIVAAVLASGGLWQLILYSVQRRDTQKSALTRLMLGLAYRELVSSCMESIDRGYISKDEYEDLVKYLYTPYEELGGNGTAERLIGEVQKLPIRKEAQ